MKKIKNLIFDLGGVLFPIDGNATLMAFAKCGVDNVENIYNKLLVSDLFRDFEVGKCSNSHFRKHLNSLMNTNLDDKTFDRCWNSMILSYPKENNPFLENLKNEGYKLFVLSNTNAIHVKYLEPLAQWKDGLFTKIYYSQEIGLRKPDLECFKWVLNDANVAADETLFIDDRADNIEAAKICGINTLHLKKQSLLYNSLYECIN